MNRAELVRRLVLNSISDDYENVDQIILPMVAEDGAKYGFAIERTEIVDGLAKAYLLSSFEPFCTEIDGMPSSDVVEEYFKTYFLVTERGMKLHLPDDGWPFGVTAPCGRGSFCQMSRDQRERYKLPGEA